MQTKAFKFSIKDVSPSGTIEGYASVFGNTDLGGDVVVAGAFSKAIADGTTEVPILWGHSMHELIGVNRHMEEDHKGLFVKGELNLDVARAREVHSLARQGAVKGLSIGYMPVKWEWQKGAEQEDSVRLLKEVKLFEYSLTPVPLNPMASISGVKNYESLLMDLKEGRTISRATRDRLQRVYEEISALLTADEAEEAAGMQDEPQEALIEQLKSLTKELTWN